MTSTKRKNSQSFLDFKPLPTPNIPTFFVGEIVYIVAIIIATRHIYTISIEEEKTNRVAILPFPLNHCGKYFVFLETLLNPC